MKRNRYVKKAPNKNGGSGQVRIIAGHLRGRQITVCDSEGLRPSGNRVRETLFNWLQAEVAGGCCLDLFAGSGALGFEAASRGAQRVDMVEKSSVVHAHLQRNIATLGLTETVFAHCVDALQTSLLQCLPTAPMARYDVVFIDPPFAQQLQQPALAMLVERGLLAEHALVYVEAEKRVNVLPQGENWRLIRHQYAGEVQFGLYSPA